MFKLPSLIKFITFIYWLTAFTVAGVAQGNPISGISTSNIPQVSNLTKSSYEPYLNFYSSELIDWAPDDNQLIFRSDFNGSTQVCITNKDPLPFLLTDLQGMPASIKVGNNGFTYREKGGDKQFYFYHFNSKISQPLTHENANPWGNVLSNDDSIFAYSSNIRNGTDYDIYITSLSNKLDTQRVFKGDGFWMPISFSKDNQKLLVSNFINFTYNHFYELNLNTNNLLPLTNDSLKKWYGYKANYSASGKYAIFCSEDLFIYNLQQNTLVNLTEQSKNKVTAYCTSKSEDIVVYVTNYTNSIKLYYIETKENQNISLPQGYNVENLKLSFDNKKLATTLYSPIGPSQVWIYNIEAKQWKNKTPIKPSSAELSFVMPAMINYPTFDSTTTGIRTIETIYYQPKTEVKHPVFIELHGGLNHRATAYFDPFKQYLIKELNMAILIPNFRGSSGYGSSFQDLDNGLNKFDQVKDIGKLLDWIKLQPNLDTNNIFIYGVSQGGRLSISTLAEYDDRIRGAIAGSGIYDINLSLSSVKANEKEFINSEYGDIESDVIKQYLANISPVNNAFRITKPVFLFHGESDKVVPIQQSLNLKAELESLGNIPWYLTAQDEGHHRWSKLNQSYLDMVIITFLTKQLVLPN